MLSSSDESMAPSRPSAMEISRGRTRNPPRSAYIAVRSSGSNLLVATPSLRSGHETNGYRPTVVLSKMQEDPEQAALRFLYRAYNKDRASISNLNALTRISLARVKRPPPGR